MSASQRRQHILNEARAAFLEAGEGISGVSARTIAQRCGVDQALIFRHFGTKEDLYMEAVLDPIETVVKRLATGARVTSPSELPTERVQRMWDLTYDVIVGMCSLPPDVVRAVAMLLFRKSGEAPAFYEKTLGPALRELESVVESELSNWNHRPFSPPLSVRIVVATCFWVVVESDVAGTPVDRDGTARNLTNLLLFGMVDPEAPTEG